MVQTAASLAPSRGRAWEQRFFPLPALKGKPWPEALALSPLFFSRLMEPTPGSSVEMTVMRTDRLQQPALHSLENSGTQGHLMQMWVPSLSEDEGRVASIPRTHLHIF